MNDTIEVSPEQLVLELEERIIQQMTTHHIEIQNANLEIARLKRELRVVYTSLLHVYVKSERAKKVCEEKIEEFGGKIVF